MVTHGVATIGQKIQYNPAQEVRPSLIIRFSERRQAAFDNAVTQTISL